MAKIKTIVGEIVEREHLPDFPVGIIYLGLRTTRGKYIGFFTDAQKDPGLVGNNLGIRQGDTVIATSIDGLHEFVQVILRPKKT